MSLATQWLLLTQSNGLSWTMRDPDTGIWAPWIDVLREVGPTPGTMNGVALAVDGSGNMQCVVVTSDNSVWHTMRYSTGPWQKMWGKVTDGANVGPAPGTIQGVAAGFDSAGNFEVTIAVGTSNLYHTLRYPNATWQRPGWGSIDSQIGIPSGNIQLLAGG